MRLIRHKVFHEGTFEHILRRLRGLRGCHKYKGRYWRLAHAREGVRIYRKVSHDLGWVEERLRDYEHFFYSSLAAGHCGRDGMLRERTRDVRRSAGGGFKQG